MSAASERGNYHCPRCKTVRLSVLPDSPPEITFYACARCNRQFAKRPGKSLCDRWLSPIGQALYPVIFAHAPSREATRVAELFFHQRSRDELERMVGEIKLELRDPAQRVRDILNFAFDPSEEELREYLRLVVERLKARGV